MNEESEEATFAELKKEGQILVLLDGRELWVNPGDTTLVASWSHTAKLEICQGEGVFSLNVRNTVNDAVIRARWIGGFRMLEYPHLNTLQTGVFSNAKMERSSPLLDFGNKP
jgi:hypothetical protein